MKKLIPLATVAILYACAGTGQQGFSSFGQTKVVESDQSSLFQITTNYLREIGYKLKTVDKQTLEVETEYKPGAGWSGAFAGDKRAKIKAKVTKVDETKSTLVVEIFSEERDGYSWHLLDGGSPIARSMYDRVLGAISARAESQVKK